MVKLTLHLSKICFRNKNKTVSCNVKNTFVPQEAYQEVIVISLFQYPLKQSDPRQLEEMVKSKNKFCSLV